MPVEERSTKSLERCDQHPSRSAVARCAGCGRPMCLPCALPVRGRVLGLECVPEDLVPEPPVPEVQGPRPSRAAGAAIALSVLATLLPWSRFGPDAGAFGAWGGPARWALVSTAAAVIAAAIWLVARLGRIATGRTTDVVLAALGVLVVVGAALAIWHPPAFTRTWLGSWVALLGGVATVATATLDARGRTRPERARS